MFEPRDTRLVVLNLQNGTELWSRVLEPNVTFVGNATVGGDWVGVSTWFQEGQKPKYALCVLSGDTGKMRWRVISERGPSWGPVVARGMVLFKAEGKLHAVTADGQEKYALAVAPDPDYSRLFREDGEADNDDDAFFDREAYSAHDNWLLVQKKDETACYEVETGKPLWTVSGTFDWHNALVRGDTCFLTVGVEVKKLVKGKMKLPQAVEELQDKESKEEMQKMAESAASREEVSWLAFSRDTGKLLWRQSGLLGEPVGDAKRLVGVVDTQRTSKIEMMTGGEGVLIVQQFSWRNGTVLWRRQSTLGVAEPCVVGKRLIGFEYTREKRSSLLGGMMGNRRPDDEGPKSAGLVALRLK
jgi:hypothetical protein